MTLAITVSHLAEHHTCVRALKRACVCVCVCVGTSVPNHTSAFVPAAADCAISDELAKSPLFLSHPITAVIDIRPTPHHSDKILIKINNTATITN